MASQKSIKLYIYQSETSSLPFCYPNGEQIEISAFKYNAKRMGGTPTITCTLRSQYCLDSDWKNSIYCVFRDEKFYLRQTPSGTKSNTEYGYSYNLEFVSERDLLNNVYMFDAVNTEEEFDKPASNSTKISFFGDINRFADKINASLRYSGLQKKDSEGNILGYKVIVDKGITSEEKYVLIEDTFFSNAIQEIYNTFEIPYYFKGKEIHIGDKDALIPTVFKYGVDESLLSIKRENSNNKIVNRATGFGSTDNIPYYYPNKSPKGDISVDASEGLNVKIVNYDRFANQVDIDEVLTYTVGSVSVLLTQASDDGNHYDTVSASPVDCVSGQTTKKWFRSHVRIKKTARYRIKGDLWFNGSEQEDFIKYIDFISLQDENFVEIPRVFNKEDGYFDLGVREAGDYWIIFGFQLTYRGMPRYMVSFNPVVEFDSGWKNAKGKSITLSDAGLEIVGDTVPKDGDTIKQILIKKLNNATNLMPSIYRKTDGRERFYNAINGKYVDESGNPIAFNNPYIEGRPSEDIINVEDIKPTIKECVNSGNQRIDMFSEIAYDDGDNDEVYTDSEGNTAYKHPHFFVKLRKLPFNLFDCAIEGSEMTFSITKGDCGACSFKVKVDDEFPYKNTVQVYEEDTTDDKGVLHKRGTLVKDENGMVLCGLDGFQPKVKPQDIQQDTINNEVWIALEKEEETYGILMPKAPKYNDSGNIEEAGYRIKPCSSDTTDDGDTFVILNIHLPEEYITAAEKKLEDVIIANMKDNNDEKFNFSITFSSIFFEEHPEILSLLDENSQIKIEYAGEQITQFVSSFSYNMNSDSALPSISVELSDSLSVSQNSIKTAINQVQLNVKKALEQESIAQQEAFISKTENDVVNGNIDFRKGVKFGDGCKVDIDEYNNTKLIIDYLTVNKKAVFTALDVQDMHHIGGRVLITPASMICNKVEEFTDFYRCYFQNYDDGGNQIFNNFVVDDQAICKTLNTWGTTYYWRLVVGVGNNYIDLSKTDCDSNSDAPRAGDKIVQLGNRSTNDNSRKSAIEISAYGDNTPSLVMYTDIDSYSLKSKEIHGTIYRNNNGEYEAYFYNYGSMLLGDPNKEKDYIEFDASKGIFEVKANVKFKASQSLDDIDAFKNLSTNVGSNTTAITQINTTLGTVNENISSLDYLKEAILDGNTQVMGGLILSSLIQLGFKEGEDFKIMSGINGVYDSNKFGGGVASWFGGAMQDKEHLAEGENEENSAKSLFRFDGTGYLASGNITWDEKGYGQIGGEGDNYALKWNDKEVRIGPNIKLGAGDETIAMLANLLNMFELDTTSVAGKTLIHAKYDGLYSDGDIAAGGAWAGTPSEGGKNYLNELLDVQLATSSLNVGDMLMWNGVKYVNIPQSSITPDLSEYATQQWVLDKKYITSVPVTSVVGQTGNITVAQVATALTDAGYKLTDTTYELATTTSNGLMSSSDKVKLNNIEEGANKYIHPTTAGYKHIPSGGSSGQILRWSADGAAVWGEDKDTTYPPATQSANGLMSATDKTKLDGIAANANNYTLPTASSSTKGGIKVGATLSISGEVLDLKSGFPKGTYTKVQIDDYGRVSSGSTLSASDIPSLPWSKITTGKPTTISGYGITDAYTKTETDNKVAELQSLLDSMFERVYDSNNKLIRIHSNVTISSSGDLVAGGDSEGGGTSGGAYTQLEWNAIKALTQSESGLLASAYSVKEAYNELNTAIETLAGKATNVTFAQTLTSGKQIGSISIDGKSTSLYAPASYAWSEITGKPSFATVATSGSYTDLANKPTIASLMGSAAIGGTSSYIYWNGSAWATKALGSNAFTSITKVSQLTNDSGYITGITKAMVEGVLIGNITSHTHSYLPLSGGTMSNTNVVTNLNADLLDGYHRNEILRRTINPTSVISLNDVVTIGIDFTSWDYAHHNVNNQPLGDGASSAACVVSFGTAYPFQIYSDYNDTSYLYYRSYYGSTGWKAWRRFAFLDSNVASASKWANARTITLTGSVTGSVSIDGSANVSLATTTNHTHTFGSLTDKPTTLSGYGITDALPLNGNRGAIDFDTQFINGIEYVSELSTNGGVPYAIIYTAIYGDAGMQANFGRNSALKYRSYQGSRWFDWRTVYDDHNANNASTVWSAKRLATPYNLICPFTWAQNNGITGTLVLSLPYGFNSMMQCIELTVYDYSSTDGSQGATKFFINGYNYSGNNGIWINPYVFRIGNKNVRVRLGYYNNKCCILIGETNTDWNYPRICVDKVYGSFSESPYAYKDNDWSCAILQDESQITHVKTASDTPLYAPCYTRAGLPYVTDNDVAAKYLSLGGGILNTNTSIGFRAYSAISGGGGWALNVINLYDRAATKRFGGLGFYGDNLNLNCIYLGTGEYSDVNLRIYGTGQSDLKWGTNPILHAGNYNSYTPKLDGTGATGTWGINISGNADTLDGYHASSFYQLKSIRSDQNSIYDLRYNYGTYDKGDFNGTYKDEYPTNYGAYLALTYNDKNTGALMFFDTSTGNVLGHIYVRTRGAGDSQTTYSEWGTLAYLTDNVASATKLQNPRTIWGQSFDGTGNVSGALKDVTDITASGTVTSSNADFLRSTYGSYGTIFESYKDKMYVLLTDKDGQTGANNSLRPLTIEQSNGNVYLATTTEKVGIGTTSPTEKLHVSGNILLTESIRRNGDTMNPFLIYNFSATTSGGWARSVLECRVDDKNAFRIAPFGEYTVGATNNKIQYVSLGFADYNGLNLRISDTSLTWGNNAIYHAGNCNLSTVPWSCSNLILKKGGMIYNNGGRYGLYVNSAADDYGSAIYLTHDHGQNQTAFRIHSHYGSRLGGLSIGFSTTTQNYGASPLDATYADIVHIRGDGNVGIGTTSPAYKLHIVGTAYASENIIATGDLTAGSDIRYKDKIQDLRLSVHDIALAPAFTYKWNNREDALVHIGSSAQYWLNTDAKDAVYYDKQNDFYHLNYASLALCNTIILARGMETQEEKIARLEERIKELEDKIRQNDSCR